MNIVVFTKPASLGVCPQCNRAKSFLNSKGVEFSEEDITNSATIEKLKEDNDIFMAPVVALVDEVTEEVISFHMGFVPEKINEIIKTQKEGVLVGATASSAFDSSSVDDMWDF